LDIIDVVVTDASAPESFLELLRQRGIHVAIAGDKAVEPLPLLPVETVPDPGLEPETFSEPAKPSWTMDEMAVHDL
jgi:hypothetical protein